MRKKTLPRPAALPAAPNPLGHGYCWAEHPEFGVRCTNPRGHEQQGVDHLDPYSTPPVTWK